MPGQPSSPISPGDSKSKDELKPESKASGDAGLKDHPISFLLPSSSGELKQDFLAMKFKHLKPRFLHSLVDKKQEAKKPPSWVEALGNDIVLFSSSDIVLKEMIGKDSQGKDKGFFGRLYRGICFGKEVAVKKLKTRKIQKEFNLSEDEARDETFEYEVTRLASLRHPRIVRFYGLYTEKSERMFVMEYCEGGTLSLWLYDKTQPLSNAQRWRLVYDIAQGLLYLHQQGVVHRDLKPDNILLDSLKRAKLADLGIARVDPLIGKEAKVVREIKPYRSSQEDDLETTGDIYSLGLIVWQLVTREPLPLTSDDKPDIPSMKAQIPPDCSPLFHSLIVGCLEEKPEQRPKADDIVQMLEEVAPDFHPQGESLRACQKMEALLEEHQRLKEERVPLYVTPFSVDEDLDRYWQRWEAKEKKESKGGEVKSQEEKFSEPLLLEQCEQSFLKDAKSAVWVLFGDGGLGKTYSVHQLAGRLLEEHLKTLEQKSPSFTTWLPLLIRPSLSSWSHTQLKEGLQTCLHYYGLDSKDEAIKEMRLLFILDGYDELQVDKDPQNLPQELGLSQFPHAKLIVTCRRDKDKLPPSEEVTRFGLEGHCTRSYLLPLRLDILLKRLGSQLKWKHQEQEHYQIRLQEASSLRAALRNPFVLTLFIKSWPLLSQEDFRQLTRLGIYEGFIYHWLTSQSVLLKEVESILEPLRDETGTLFGSFCAFSEGLAFYLYQMSSLSLPSSKMEHSMGHSPLSAWGHLKELIKKASLQRWEEKAKELSHSSDSRLILRQEDYAYLMQAKAERFQGLSPLKHRSVGWEFIHKSFLEYFVARFMIERCDNEPLDKLVSFLSYQAIQKENGILGFLVELFKEERALQPKRQEQLMGLIEASKKEPRFSQAAANAITILNRANIPFSGLDLTRIRIPGADLSFSNLDNTLLQGADLTDVILEGAWLRQTDFRGSQMQGVQFREWAYLKFPEEVTSCCYSADGRWLAVGCKDRNIYLYDTKSHQLQRTLKGHNYGVNSVVFDSKSQRLASGSTDGTVRLWEISSGHCERVLKGHSYGVNSVAFDRADARLASGSSDNTVRLWEVSSGRCERVLKGHNNRVMSVAFDREGARLASGGDDRTVRLWEASSGRCERVLEGHNDSVNSVTFTSEGARLASASRDRTVRLWEVSSGRCERVLEGHSDRVNSIAFASAGARLASGSDDRTVRLWEVSSGRCERVLEGHNDSVHSVAFDSVGARLASGSMDNTIRVWDISSGHCERVLEGHSYGVNSVALDSAGARLASGGSDKTVYLWEVWSGRCERVLEGHNSGVQSVAFDIAGTRLASGSDDKTVRLWEASSGRCERVLEGHNYWVMSVAFDGRGARLASGSMDNTIRVWDISSGRCERVLEGHNSWVKSVTFDSAGVRLASGSGDRTVRLWEVSSGRCERVLEGHNNWVTSIVFDIAGVRLASGSKDKTVRLWEVSSGRCECVLKGHNDRVDSIAFDSGGARLASGSWDKTVRFWSVKSGACLLIIKGFTGLVESIAWQPVSDNPKLITGSTDKAVRCWQIQEKEKDKLSAILCWSSYQTILVASEARLDNVKGLSQENLKLLQQRGAHVSVEEKKKSSSDKGDEKSRISPETHEDLFLKPSSSPAKASTTFFLRDSKSAKGEEGFDAKQKTKAEKKGEAKSGSFPDPSENLSLASHLQMFPSSEKRKGIFKLKESPSVNLSVIRHFTGEDKGSDSKDLRQFNHWYGTQAIESLVFLKPSQSLRCVFHALPSIGEVKEEEGIGKRKVKGRVFENQMRSLQILKNRMNVNQGCFIGFEPDEMGSNSHFIFGMMLKDSLVVIDPLGTKPKEFFSQTLSVIRRDLKFNRLYVSRTPLQKDPEGLVSCGTLCTELMLHISQIEEALLQATLASMPIERQERVLSTKEIFEYHTIDIAGTSLLPSSCQGLLTATPDIYIQQMTQLRQSHLRLLETTSTTESDSYEQSLFNYLTMDSGALLDIEGDERFQQVKERFASLHLVSSLQAAQASAVSFAHGRASGSGGI